MGSKNIETGVDKLVGLIESQKRISLDDAAKKLGVSTVLVQEWADFLEEDGLISIEYSLSKVWLVERKLSKTEVEKKTKEYANKKESFIRKVETTLKSLDRDTIGFEKMKAEFQDLKGQIGGEIDSVKKDFQELARYETLKNNIDKDIDRQKTEYQRLMQQSHQEIKTEERRYHEMMAQIAHERLKVNKDRQVVKTMEEQEILLLQRIDGMNGMIESIRKAIKKEQKDIVISEENLKKLERFVEQVENRLKEKKHATILPLIQLSESHGSKITNLQDQIIDKLKDRKKELESYKGQKKAVYKDLQKFFEKKTKAEKMLLDIDTKKKSLAQEYEEIIKKAQAFNAISKDATVKKHVTELEGAYKKVEQHKSGLQEEIRKLTSLIKG
jgi:hypothetical protein